MSAVAPGVGTPPLILVAEDDRVTRKALCVLLRDAGYRVDEAADGQEAVDRVVRGGVALALLDDVMPRMTGLEACRLVKSIDPESFLPVVLLTARADVDARIEGLRLGADDYVGKPYDERELLARVGAMLRIKAQSDAVREAHRTLEQLATHDELTGIYNFRHLSTRLAEEWKRAERFHEPLAAVMVGLDGFRAFNAEHGDRVGDAVLRQVAARVRRAVRDIDVVARYGGDEFLVLLPNTHLAGAVTVADRISREVRTAAPAGDDGEPLPLTASLGVAAFPSRDVRTRDGLLKCSAEALAEAKQQGRDRVFVAAHQGYVYGPGSQPPLAVVAPGGERGERAERADREEP